MSASSGTNPKMVAALAGLAGVAGFVMVWRPQSAALADARDDRVAAEAALASFRSEMELTVSPAQLSPEDAARAAVLLRGVPEHVDLAPLLRQLQAIARETGMVVESLAPAPLASNLGAPGGNVQVSLSAGGTKAATEALLGRLRDLERVAVIEQVNLQERDDTAVAVVVEGDAVAAPEVQLQLMLRVFTVESPAAPADDES